MTTDSVDDLTRARGSLARRRDNLAKRIGATELAEISMAEDLTRVLTAIEAIDRALANAGHPHFEGDL